MNETLPTEKTAAIEKRFQNYRGTWAWLTQRISAILLFLLIPVKIYTGWAARDMVPYPDTWASGKKIHLNAGIDIALLLCFLLHGFYGLRVILIDFGIIKADSFFWRTMFLSLGIFGAVIWYVYFHRAEK